MPIEFKHIEMVGRLAKDEEIKVVLFSKGYS